MRFDVRPAEASDGEPIRDVVRAALIEHGLPPDPSHTDADLDDVLSFYVARGGLFDVALDEDGVLVGTVGVLPLENGRCELRKMYLAPRARRHGLGQRLLDRAMTQARLRGFTVMELETAAPLKAAMALYEKNGFVRVERAVSVSRCDRAYERVL